MACFFVKVLLGDNFLPIILVLGDYFGEAFTIFLFIFLLLHLWGFIHGTVLENMHVLVALSAIFLQWKGIYS